MVCLSGSGSPVCAEPCPPHGRRASHVLSHVHCHLAFQLVLTVGLLAVVVYLYTVVAFNFFRKFYNKSEDGDAPDMKCDDMLTVSSHVWSRASENVSAPQPESSV